MDATVVGTDAAKDRLDVAVRPTGEVVAVGRMAVGRDDEWKRVAAPSPRPDGSRPWSAVLSICHRRTKK
jgi:hypothetical protein